MTRHDEIRRSYKALGDMGTLYDGIITRSTLLGKVMDSLVWGLDKELAGTGSFRQGGSRTRSRRSRRISPGACSRCRWARAC